MKVLDFSTTHSQISDWIINVPNSNPVNNLHDIFYNKTGKLVQIWTGAGQTGTQLTETTDYTLGGAFTDADFPTSISPDVGYTTIAITNATYHNTDLYVTFYPIADVVDAETRNTDTYWTFATAGGADYDVLSVAANLWIKFTRDASTQYDGNLPDASATQHVGQRIAIQSIGPGTGDIGYTTQSSQTIGGGAASTVVHRGTGILYLLSDGSNWVIQNTGPWDTYTDSIVKDIEKWPDDRCKNGQLEYYSDNVTEAALQAELVKLLPNVLDTASVTGQYTAGGADYVACHLVRTTSTNFNLEVLSSGVRSTRTINTDGSSGTWNDANATGLFFRIAQSTWR